MKKWTQNLMENKVVLRITGTILIILSMCANVYLISGMVSSPKEGQRVILPYEKSAPGIFKSAILGHERHGLRYAANQDDEYVVEYDEKLYVSNENKPTETQYFAFEVVSHDLDFITLEISNVHKTTIFQLEPFSYILIFLVAIIPSLILAVAAYIFLILVLVLADRVVQYIKKRRNPSSAE